MINSLGQIEANLQAFEDRYDRPLNNFWPNLTYPDEPFFQPPGPEDYEKTLVLSGPSRNGNHLVHSLLDNHPNLPRTPGEDSTIPVLIPKTIEQPYRVRDNLTSPGCVDYLINVAGETRDWEFPSKWRAVYEFAKEGLQETETYSGVYKRENRTGFVFDYQDTVVDIDFPAYEAHLIANEQALIESDHLYTSLNIYLQALSKLDPQYEKRRADLEYPLVTFGSGMREELYYMLNSSDEVYAVTPIRPFETYFYSFTRSYHGVNRVSPWLLKEGWEHWFHKVTDYVILKRKFPERVCLVQFDHLIKHKEDAVREILKFLDVPFHKNCLKPTVLGEPTKGNSKEEKSEDKRGEVYESGLKDDLDPKYIPDVYDEFWEGVQSLCI